LTPYFPILVQKSRREGLGQSAAAILWVILAYLTTTSPSSLTYPSAREQLDSHQIATMEALLHQSKGVCPFLKKTSAATLRSLSTSTRQSPGGGTITNLHFIARRCPVMNKALAVQSARLGSRRSYGNSAAGTGLVKSLLEKKLHTSAEKKASVDTNMFRPPQPSMSCVQETD
jgi:hypothetical protein